MTSTTEKDRPRKANTTAVSAISGLMAASVGKALLHPIDTLKAKLQVLSLPSAGTTINKEAPGDNRQSVIMRLAQDTVKAEGVRGLYRGFGIHVAGGIPAGGLYFGSYEFFKKHTLQVDFLKQHPFMAYLIGGMFAEVVACLLFVPVDVIKERRQVQSNLRAYEYTSDLNAIRSVMQTEGIRGLYRAYWATVASFGPFSALYFTFYESLKGYFINNSPEAY